MVLSHLCLLSPHPLLSTHPFTQPNMIVTHITTQCAQSYIIPVVMIALPPLHTSYSHTVRHVTMSLRLELLYLVIHTTKHDCSAYDNTVRPVLPYSRRRICVAISSRLILSHCSTRHHVLTVRSIPLNDEPRHFKRRRCLFDSSLIVYHSYMYKYI